MGWPFCDADSAVPQRMCVAQIFSTYRREYGLDWSEEELRSRFYQMLAQPNHPLRRAWLPTDRRDELRAMSNKASKRQSATTQVTNKRRRRDDSDHQPVSPSRRLPLTYSSTGGNGELGRAGVPGSSPPAHHE